MGQTDIQLFVCQKLLAFRFLSVLIKKKKLKFLKTNQFLVFCHTLSIKSQKKKEKILIKNIMQSTVKYEIPKQILIEVISYVQELILVWLKKR